jgi:hypothetical protein
MTVARVAIGLLAACALAACQDPARMPPGPDAFGVAVIGDMPYSAQEVQVMDGLIDEIHADRSLALAIHVGDIKAGNEPCTDALLQQRQQQIARIALPLLFTPGDNEWTDCHREPAGRHLPTERLALLRRLFFSGPPSLAPLPAVQIQAASPGFETFVENRLVVFRRVVIATVHVVGSENGLEPWSGIDPADNRAAPRADRLAEFRHREAAALAWIDRAFDVAQEQSARGVLIAWQANPLFERAAGDPQRAGFDAVLARLKARTVAFGKPVLLVHGDFHQYLVDRPLARLAEPPPRAAQFARVQTFGSPRLGWVKVLVDADSPAVFSIEPGGATGKH